jgi:type I restriction enzyme S subunit
MAASSDSAFQDSKLPGLPRDWKWLRLRELVDQDRGICYGIVQPGGHAPNGVPMVNSQDIFDGGVAGTIDFRVAPELHARFSRSALRGGEVLLTLVGANFGRVAVAPARLAGCNCARPVGVIPVLEDAPFVMFCLRSPLSRMFMDNWANTTAQPTLNLKEVAELPIPVPPRSERSAIARILSALDDKIEVNRKTNETLEAIARALFKSWFVDFDPVRAKMEGRRLDGMNEATAALFPRALEDSSVGPVPTGWRVEPLDAVAHFLNGLALQKFPAEPGAPYLPVIKIAQLRAGDTASADRASTSVPRDYVIVDGDVLFSWSGSLEAVIWCGGRGALNQHLFKVTSTHVPRWFYFRWVREHLPEFQRIAADKATTMGHIQRGHLTRALVVVPPAQILEHVGRILEPFDKRWMEAKLETRSLMALRDTLLPKLMSGELRVRDAERAVEAAT